MSDEFHTQATLTEKLSAVQATLALQKDRPVEVKSKDGRVLYTYEYITEDAITAAIRERLCKLGVAVLVSFIDSKYEGNLASTTVVVDFEDGVTSLSVTGPGFCQDADAQKAMGKAQTYGFRTLLNKTFLQAGGDDGESVVHDGAPAAPQAAPAPPRAPEGGQSGQMFPDDPGPEGPPPGEYSGPASHAAQAGWRPNEKQAKLPWGIGKGRLGMEFSDIARIIWYATDGQFSDPKQINDKAIFDRVIETLENWQENPVANMEAVREFLERVPFPERNQ